jgi:hypothetical protein
MLHTLLIPSMKLKSSFKKTSRTWEPETTVIYWEKRNDINDRSKKYPLL